MANKREKFGKLLKFYREFWSLTQEELVKRIRETGNFGERYSKSSISKWESGKVIPKYETIEVLEDIFDLKEQELLKAAGYVLPEIDKKSGELFDDIVKLAGELRSLIYVPTVIPVSDSLSKKILPNGDTKKEYQTVCSYFEEYLASHPFTQAPYNRFISLPTSEKFRLDLEKWKQKTNHYYEIVGTTTDVEEVKKAYNDAKEAMNQALAELAEAVEALRWD